MDTLSTKEQAEMRSFIESETGRLKMQTAISEFTDKCFSKCLSNTGMKDQLTSTDQSCLRNCVGRYLDVNIHIIKNLNAVAGN